MEIWPLTVTLDTTALTITITLDDAPAPFPISLPGQDISLITFTLDEASTDAGATFPSYPMQWFDVTSEEPVMPPPWFLCHQVNSSNFSLWDFNSSPQDMTHGFKLTVAFGGALISSPDPVFINEGPVQPPPCPGGEETPATSVARQTKARKTSRR